MSKDVGLRTILVACEYGKYKITGVGFVNGVLNVQACGLDTRGNNKNTTMVKYTQNTLVVFRASLYCTCKARGNPKHGFSCLKENHNVRSYARPRIVHSAGRPMCRKCCTRQGHRSAIRLYNQPESSTTY